MKSGSGSFSPDKQKVKGLGRRSLPSDHLTFDLEGLAAAARQVRLLKAQRGRRLTARPAESEHPGTEVNLSSQKLKVGT
jgi:hypothetical protein